VEKQERKRELGALVEVWIRVRDLLSSKTPMTDGEIQTFQDTADDMRDHFVKVFGKSKITFYLNDLFAGVDRAYLKRYRSLYYYSNQGSEAMVGVLRSLCSTRTNGGQVGKGNDKGSVIDTLYLHSVRKLARAYDTIGYANGVYTEAEYHETIFADAGRTKYNENQRKRRLADPIFNEKRRARRRRLQRNQIEPNRLYQIEEPSDQEQVVADSSAFTIEIEIHD